MSWTADCQVGNCAIIATVHNIHLPSKVHGSGLFLFDLRCVDEQMLSRAMLKPSQNSSYQMWGPRIFQPTADGRVLLSMGRSTTCNIRALDLAA